MRDRQISFVSRAVRGGKMAELAARRAPKVPNHVLSSAERRARADVAGRAASVTPPMDSQWRAYHYGITGRFHLTPRQRRRYDKKARRNGEPTLGSACA